VTFASLAVRSHRWLARNRRRSSVQAAHRLAAFLEEAYENEEWDLHANGEASLLQRLAPAGFATVVDVGANVGDWSLAALNAWPRCHVHAFEVAPPTFERLVRHLAAAGLANRATLNPIGLGDVCGEREMYYYPDSPNLTSDQPRHPGSRIEPFRARLVEGDCYVMERKLHDVDFVKIDVEGAEHRVLAGFRQTIEQGRLHAIQFEYGPFSIDTRVLLADYYERLGRRYWIGKIYPGHVEFSDYHWSRERFRFANFLGIARSRPDLRTLAEG
jgi:FkbM family methyltransferase